MYIYIYRGQRILKENQARMDHVWTTIQRFIHGHGHGHGLFILATYHKGTVWSTCAKQARKHSLRRSLYMRLGRAINAKHYTYQCA
jgi:hypothetical protein